MGNIPPKVPIGDAVRGVLMRYNTVVILGEVPLIDTEIIAEGEFVIRYGVRYLEKAHHSIVPGLIALDYGDMLTGEAMWHFLWHKSNAYPRADVLGYRADGQDDMVVVKKLDLARPPVVLAYPDEHATKAIVEVDALIMPETTVVPDRLTTYLARYTSLGDWVNRDRT